jgi:hypothetical protein
VHGARPDPVVPCRTSLQHLGLRTYQAQVSSAACLACFVKCGALFGGAIGVAFLGLGLLRAALFLLSGRHLDSISSDDLRLATFYVSGFVLAGTLLGGFWQLFRSKATAYLEFALAGMIVMTAIVASQTSGLRGNNAVDWVVLLLLGAGFGCAFGRGFLKWEPPAQTTQRIVKSTKGRYGSRRGVASSRRRRANEHHWRIIHVSVPGLRLSDVR